MGRLVPVGATRRMLGNALPYARPTEPGADPLSGTWSTHPESARPARWVVGPVGPNVSPRPCNRRGAWRDALVARPTRFVHIPAISLSRGGCPAHEFPSTAFDAFAAGGGVCRC